MTIRGFVMDEFMPDVDVARADMKRWNAEGRLAHQPDIRRGFEKLPQAFLSLFNGESRGTVIVESGEPVSTP